MPNLKVDDPRDVQKAYDDRFSQMKKAEQSPSQPYVDAGADQAEAYANDPDNASQKVSDQEKSGYGNDGDRKYGYGNDANWKTNVDPEKTKKDNKSKAKMFAKKGSPYAIVLAIVLGGGGIIAFFGGAGTLIVNIAQVMTNKFNYQLSTMELRERVIISSKLNDTTKGCTVVSLRCKFSTFSDKEVARFKKAGIGVNLKDDKTLVRGRNKIKSFTFNGKEIAPKDFLKTLRTDPSFANAMHSAYNMRFKGMWDSVWKKVSSKFKISKDAPFKENATDKERTTKVKATVAEGGGEVDITGHEDECDKSSDCSKEKADEEAKKAAKSKDMNTAAKNLAADSSDGPSSKMLQEMNNAGSDLGKFSTGKLATKFMNVVKITGPVDDVCMLYNTLSTVSSVAKAIRAAQMVRYAMIFLTTASMIKAGTAQPGDVAYLGNILTNVTKDEAGNLTKSATESFGYRYAAFGDKGIDLMASNAVAGASFGGKIESAISTVFRYSPVSKSKLKGTCRFLSNPFVQAGSLIIGAASFLIGLGEAKAIVQGVAAAALSFVLPFLAAYVGEIIAGNLITSSTTAEESGNFIASGSGAMLSNMANYGGGSVLHNDQVNDVLSQQRTVLASYANYDRSTLSPFDASNPNTFMGSMLTSLAPYIYSGDDSPMALIKNFGSIVMSSLSNFVSPASADGGYTDECKDSTLNDANIATDPFCNPIIGIPSQYMNYDPETVIDDLQAAQLIDDEGNPTTTGTVGNTGLNYQDFISQCMERATPYGLGGEDDRSDQCFIDSQIKAEAYIFHVDMRVDSALEDTSDDLSMETDATANSNHTLSYYSDLTSYGAV